MTSRCILLALMTLAAPLWSAPTPFSLRQTQEIRAIIDALYRIDYARASELSQHLVDRSPDDPTGYIFLARTVWQEELNRQHAISLDRFAAPDFFVEKKQYRYELNIEPENQGRFDRLSTQAIDKAKAWLERDQRDERARFLLGLAYQNLATYHAAITGSWWEAVRAGTTTRKLHMQVRSRYPEFADPLLAMGVYEYAGGSIGFFYKMLGWLLGIRSDRETGLRMLNEAARRAVLLNDDARTMLVLIYTREKRYADAQRLLAELSKRFPENYLAPLDSASISLREGRPDSALATLRNVLRKARANAGGFGRLDAGIVYNQMGIAYRRKRSYSEAADAFRRTLELPGASPQSLVVAHLELGKTLDLAEDREQAILHYQAVINAEDFAGSREEAQRLLRDSYRGDSHR